MVPEREYFWQIASPGLFYILAALAVGLFLLGVWRRVAVWSRGVKSRDVGSVREAFFRLLVDGVLGRRIFKADRAAGLMHLLIFWGFLALFAGTLLLAVDHYIAPFLTGSVYLVYSACLELAGLMVVIGLLWALVRRYVQRVPRLERRAEDLLVVLWLLAAAFSGFLVEGARLSLQNPAWSGWSFAGRWAGVLLFSPSALYPVLWWIHALLSLGLIATFPYTKLFHALAAPVSIALKDQPLLAVPADAGDSESQSYSFREMAFMDACTRCGLCVEVCPSAGAGEPFKPRDFILWARENLRKRRDPLKRFVPGGMRADKEILSVSGFDAERIWHCTTCRACLEVCPVYVATPDAMRVERAKVVEEGVRVPASITGTLEKLFKYNNPWEASKKRRTAWSEGLEIPEFAKNKQAEGLCYFVGCTTSLETRAQGLARAFSRILAQAGAPFGTLGKKEPCCGDIARRLGEAGLYEEQMEDCLKLFRTRGISDVVTSSPHCYHTFRNDYPAFRSRQSEKHRVDIRVRHYSQVLWDFVRSGAIRPDKTLSLTATYHDPCYLGRYNGIYDAPREVLRAVPGLRLVEMPHSGPNSLCCGGGGGRMWQEDLDADQKMSEIRIREAAATGAEVLITACPLCLIMLEDARKTAGFEDTLKVLDLNELLLQALGLENGENA